jgi:hypothetical protein
MAVRGSKVAAMQTGTRHSFLLVFIFIECKTAARPLKPHLFGRAQAVESTGRLSHLSLNQDQVVFFFNITHRPEAGIFFGGQTQIELCLTPCGGCWAGLKKGDRKPSKKGLFLDFWAQQKFPWLWPWGG